MVLLAVLTGWYALNWGNPELSAGVRVFLLLVISASIGYYIFLDYWNLLGWRG